jgi:hypothetical protein
MTSTPDTIRLGASVYRAPAASVEGGFATIDGVRYARIANVDQVDPFLVSIVSDSDAWLFVGSNGPFTAGRRSPDIALFPYQTVDKILRHATTSGARTSLLVGRGATKALWEPWLITASVYQLTRNLYKRVDGTAILFEEVNHDLGLRFRWRLEACERFGIVRYAELEELAGEAVDVRYLDGFHQVLPPGVDQDTYARLSYLAGAYMRHERLPDTPLAVYSLNASISDRPEPSESLRVAAAWSVGHRDPVILLSDRQLAAFRRGDDVHPELEVRGEMGAYLAVDRVTLAAGGRHAWYTIGDTRLDHAAVDDLVALFGAPGDVEPALREALERNRDGIVRRVAGADGLQRGADEAVTANHFSNVMFNIMRGGSFEGGSRVPVADLGSYLREQNREVAERHAAWVANLPSAPSIREARAAAGAQGDPQLDRLVGAYLPLTYGRRHGDPSRPWNRFSIDLRDPDGRPVYAYQGNWRDIFQNWEALGRSFPEFLPQFISVFLNASTADGYNPYRITRAGIDWEVVDPRDPWSHIGYWGDHQVIYLLRLLEAYEAHEPGALSAGLAHRAYASARVPYRIAGLSELLADPRSTIEFDRALHERLIADARTVGADGKLIRGADGEVVLATLLEKLLVPLLVKLTNFVPGGGIWLNTQRPEWNDANNALAGWGLSVVTLSAIRRYAVFLESVCDGAGDIPVSRAVAELLDRVAGILRTVTGPLDDADRYRVLVELGRAGEAHRQAVYAVDLGEPVEISRADVRAFAVTAREAVEATLRASRRPDGLFHSYNVLRIDGDRASVLHLGPMLEGQVAILDSGMLTDTEAVELLQALRAGPMYRADQHSYMLYPDRVLTPFLERNTLEGEPPVQDPSLFTRDRHGSWHFQADLSTLADVEARLDRLAAGPGVRATVLELWRTTFAYDEFTGRSGTFFMFEGLGSVYWHMVAKLLLAVQACQARASDPAAAAALADHYHDIRDGLGFRRSPESYGAFPTDAYSHTPAHRGAQQPGMTGQVKEQVLARFGELGAEVTGGRLGFRPRLLLTDEFLDAEARFEWLDVAGGWNVAELPANSLVFTYCQVPVSYVRGDVATIELERTDGRTEIVAGSELGPDASRAILERTGMYRRITVTLPSLRG